MTSKNFLYTIPVKYGVYGALLLIVLYSVMFYVGKHPLPPGFADVRFLLVPIFIFFSIKEFKDYRNDKILHFWQGLLIGFLVSFVIGVITALFIYVFAQWIAPDFLVQYIEERIQLMHMMLENKVALEKTMNEEMVQEQMRLLPQTTSFKIALTYLGKTILIGILFNIIISVILRRQPKRFT